MHSSVGNITSGLSIKVQTAHVQFSAFLPSKTFGFGCREEGICNQNCSSKMLLTKLSAERNTLHIDPFSVAARTLQIE